MNFVLDKVSKFSNFLGVNGPGPSSSNNGGASGSWLVEVLAWLGDAVIKIATLFWGWVITLFYWVIRICLNIIDILQMFIEKLVGIEVYNQEGGLSAVEKLEDTDIIIRFITNETVLKTFGAICLLGVVLLIVFSIIALVKQNYNAAVTDPSDAAKKGPRDVLKYIGRAVFMCLLVPFLVIFGILGSNAVLASVCNAIRGDNNLTIGGIIYTVSAYEANKFREYANDGIRVPIIQNGATEVVVPSNYREEKDMQVLFYKLAKGTVYIESISDSNWFKEQKPNYSKWSNDLEVEDIDVNIDKLTGSEYFRLFKSDFKDWYNEFFDGKEKLAELGMFNEHINSIYKTNWTANKKYVETTYDFSSTYKISSNVSFSLTGELPEGGSSSYVASIIDNSGSYVGHENFATIELEYYVMADLIDFAVEQGMTLYYVNASNNMIKWGDIDLDPEDEEDEIIDINEYNAKYFVAQKSDSVGGKSYITGGHSEASFESTKSFVETANKGYTLLADSAFIVRYHTGLNRLYWSTEDATSEDDGATFIVCFKMGDNYIPVTQETTKFSSAFLAEDYTGPVVARGIFEAEGVIPKDYCLPTAISEQVVDASGRELVGVEKISPFSLLDSYDPSVEDTALSKMEGFVGTLSDLTGGYLWWEVSLLSSVIESGMDAWQKWLTEDLVKAIGEDDSGTGNLLINPNIYGFSYNNDETPTEATFYDKNGRKIAIGGSQSATTNIPLEAGSNFNKESYLVLQMSRVNDIVIPWYYAEDSTLETVIDIINSTEDMVNGNKKPTYLILKYTYDNVQMKLGEDLYRMLLNFNVAEIYEVRRDATTFGLGKTSGEFIVLDKYEYPGIVDIVVERRVDLVVSGGEVFYSNGEMFFGREDAKKLYTDYMENYIKELFTDKLDDYIHNKSAGNNFWVTISRIAFGDKISAEILQGLNDGATDEDWNNVYLAGKTAGLWSGDDPDNIDGKKEVIKKYIMAMLSATEYRAGLASYITNYNKAYYTTEETYTTQTTYDAASGKTITTQVLSDLTIKFYDPNNKETQTLTGYKTKTRIQDNKVIIRVAVVSAPGANKNLISYATIVDSGSEPTEDFALPTGANDLSIIDVMHDLIFGATDYNSRYVWFYDVAYTFSYDEYAKEHSADKIALGLTIDGVSVSHVASKTINGSETVDPVQNLIRIRNGGIYSDVLKEYILTPESAMKYIVNNVESDGSGCVKNKFTRLGLSDSDPPVVVENNLAISDLASITADTISAESRSEYNNFYTYFVRGKFNWMMLFDFCIHLPTIEFSLKPYIAFAFRFRLGTAYNYTEKVVWRLHGGSFYLDYNFVKTVGIGQDNIYRMSAINPFILVFSAVLVLDILWKAVWGLIKRIYEILILFLMLPAVCATMPVDEGSRFGKWTKEIIDKIFSAYSVLIMLNLYFVLVPIVKDVTSDLITLGDIPQTITGMFGTISAGIQSFGGTISNLGSKFVGGISSVGGKVGNFFGSIGMNNFTLAKATEDLTSSQQVLLGHVNKIIYLMFFLVLTTLLKGGGKSIFEDILSIGKLDDKVLDNVKDVQHQVANSRVVTTPKWIAKTAGQLAGNGVKFVAGAAAGILTKSPIAAKMVWSTMEKPDAIPPGNDNGGSDSFASGGGGEGTAYSDGAMAGGEGIPTEGGGGYSTGGGASYVAGPASGIASRFAGYAEGVKSRFDNHGEVEEDEIYQRAAQQLDGMSESEINEYIIEHGNNVKEKIYNMSQWRPAEGVLPEGMPRMTYEEYLNAIKNAPDEQTREKLEQVRYAYDGITDQTYKTFKEEGYYQVTDAHHYKEIRRQNEQAEMRRQATIRQEEADRAGMTEEQKETLDSMFKDRASVIAAKDLIDSTYTGAEREMAHAEVDAEISRINRNIDRYMDECHAGSAGVASTGSAPVAEASVTVQPAPAGIGVGGVVSSATLTSTIEKVIDERKPQIRLGASPEELGKMNSAELKEYTDGVLQFGKNTIDEMKAGGHTEEAIERMRNNINQYKQMADEFYELKREEEIKKGIVLDPAKKSSAKKVTVTNKAELTIQVNPQKTAVVTSPPPKVISSYGGVMTAQGASKTAEIKGSKLFIKNAKTIFKGGVKGIGAYQTGKKVGQLIRATVTKTDLSPQEEVPQSVVNQINAANSAKDAEYRSRIGELEKEIKGLTEKIKNMEYSGVAKSNVADKIKVDHKSKVVDDKLAKLDSKINNLNNTAPADYSPEVETETSVRVRRTVRPGETKEEAQKAIDKVMAEKMAEAKKIAENMPTKVKVEYEKPTKQIKRNSTNAKKMDDFWENTAAPEMVDKQSRPKTKTTAIKKSVKIDVDLK